MRAGELAVPVSRTFGAFGPGPDAPSCSVEARVFRAHVTGPPHRLHTVAAARYGDAQKRKIAPVQRRRGAAGAFPFPSRNSQRLEARYHREAETDAPIRAPWWRRTIRKSCYLGVVAADWHKPRIFYVIVRMEKIVGVAVSGSVLCCGLEAEPRACRTKSLTCDDGKKFDHTIVTTNADVAAFA